MDNLKYERLKQIIKNNIREGLWKPGDKIPVEKDLCKTFGVSKITVKKAKNDLVAEGVLEHLPGRRGSFIRKQQQKSIASNFIGVAITDIMDPFIAETYQGIEDKLWENRMHPVLCNAYYDIEKIKAYFESLLHRGVAGVIFTPVIVQEYIDNNKRMIDMLEQQGIPYVLLDRNLPDILANAVVSDNRQASKKLTERLLQKGHKRILLFSGIKCSSMTARVQGFLEAIEEAGLTQDEKLLIQIDEFLFRDQRYQKEEIARVRKMVEDAGEFTACYTLNSNALRTAIQTVFPKKDRTKRKIELATYDYAVQELHGVVSHVTVVKQPAYRMGWKSAKLLIDMLNKQDSPIIQMTLRSKIIENVIE